MKISFICDTCYTSIPSIYSMVMEPYSSTEKNPQMARCPGCMSTAFTVYMEDDD